MALRSPTPFHNDWGVFAPGLSSTSNLPNVAGPSPTQSTALQVGDTATVSTTPPTKYICTDATLGAATWVLIATGSGGGGPGPFSNVVYVDRTRGNNGTGVRGDDNLPFQTIDAALSVAQVGDTILVGPGVYGPVDLDLGPSGLVTIAAQLSEGEECVIESTSGTAAVACTVDDPRVLVGLQIRNTGPGSAIEVTSAAGLLTLKNCRVSAPVGARTCLFEGTLLLIDQSECAGLWEQRIGSVRVIDSRGFSNPWNWILYSNVSFFLALYSTMNNVSFAGGFGGTFFGRFCTFNNVDEVGASGAQSTIFEQCRVTAWFPVAGPKHDMVDCTVNDVTPPGGAAPPSTIYLPGTTIQGQLDVPGVWTVDLVNTSIMRSRLGTLAGLIINANIIDSQTTTAYIDGSNGSDQYGQVQNPNAPFQTIDAAMAATPTPTNLVFAEGTYTTAAGISFTSPAECSIRARAGRVTIASTGSLNLIEQTGGGGIVIEGDITLDASSCTGYALQAVSTTRVVLNGVTIIPGGGGTQALFAACGDYREYNGRLAGGDAIIQANVLIISGANDDAFSGRQLLATDQMEISGSNLGSVVDTTSGATRHLYGRGVVMRTYQCLTASVLQFYAKTLEACSIDASGSSVDLSGADFGQITNISGAGSVNTRGTIFGVEPTIAPSVWAVEAPRTFTKFYDPANFGGSYDVLPTDANILVNVFLDGITPIAGIINLPPASQMFGAIRISTTTDLGGGSLSLVSAAGETIDNGASPYVFSGGSNPVSCILISDTVNWYFAALRT